MHYVPLMNGNVLFTIAHHKGVSTIVVNIFVNIFLSYVTASLVRIPCFFSYSHVRCAFDSNMLQIFQG